MNLRFVDLRLGDSLAVMLSGQVQRRGSKDWARPSMSCEDRGGPNVNTGVVASAGWNLWWMRRFLPAGLASEHNARTANRCHLFI